MWFSAGNDPAECICSAAQVAIRRTILSRYEKRRIWFPSFQQPKSLSTDFIQRLRCRCWMPVNEEKGRIKLSWFRLKLSIHQHRRVRDIRYIPRALCCCCLRFEEARTRVHARLFRAGCCLSYFCWNVTKMSLIAVAAALLSCFIPEPSS